MIAVFLSLSAAHSHIRLKIVGEGSDEQRLKSLVLDNAAEHVKFLGRREDVAQLLLQADIFVQYSTSEGLSRSILEAIASGLPVVVSDVGGNRELVENGENGFLVSANDPNELYKALETLVTSPELRRDMGNKSAARSKETFDFNQCSSEYIDLYQRLLAMRISRQH